jgi:hypothetical protein
MALGNGPARTMAAEFDSECPGCFEQIDTGDTITLIAGSWVCPDCAHDDDPIPGGRPRRDGPTTPWDGTSTEQMGY